jgi:hypothetical protein
MSNFKTIYGDPVKRTHRLRANGAGLFMVMMMVMNQKLIPDGRMNPK